MKAGDWQRRRHGFTLVEIMIVVGIIGLLATIAIPSFAKARRNAQASTIAAAFRVFEDAFQQFLMANNSNYPAPDWVQGSYPAGMQDWLPDKWIQPTPVDGYWVFHDGGGSYPLLILLRPDIDQQVMTRVDEILDDGDLGTGKVRGDGSSLDYYLEDAIP